MQSDLQQLLLDNRQSFICLHGYISCIHEHPDVDVTLTSTIAAISSLSSLLSLITKLFSWPFPSAGIPVSYGSFSFGFVLLSTSFMFDQVTQAHFTVVPAEL